MMTNVTDVCVQMSVFAESSLYGCVFSLSVDL